MSQLLIDKINAAREQVIETNGLQITIRRPTDLDVQEMRGQNLRIADLLKRFVVGWVGVREMDLINGGTPKLVEYSADLFAAWVSDHPDIYNRLTTAILEAYDAHRSAREDALKKPDAG